MYMLGDKITCVEIDKVHRHVTTDTAGRPAMDGYYVPDTIFDRARLEMALQADAIAGFDMNPESLRRIENAS